jgi:hypothetical protein
MAYLRVKDQLGQQTKLQQVSLILSNEFLENSGKPAHARFCRNTNNTVWQSSRAIFHPAGWL